MVFLHVMARCKKLLVQRFPGSESSLQQASMQEAAVAEEPFLYSTGNGRWVWGEMCHLSRQTDRLYGSCRSSAAIGQQLLFCCCSYVVQVRGGQQMANIPPIGQGMGQIRFAMLP